MKFGCYLLCGDFEGQVLLVSDDLDAVVYVFALRDLAPSEVGLVPGLCSLFLHYTYRG